MFDVLLAIAFMVFVYKLTVFNVKTRNELEFKEAQVNSKYVPVDSVDPPVVRVPIKQTKAEANIDPLWQEAYDIVQPRDMSLRQWRGFMTRKGYTAAEALEAVNG